MRAVWQWSGLLFNTMILMVSLLPAVPATAASTLFSDAVSDDICEYFQVSAQTWDPLGSISLSGRSYVKSFDSNKVGFNIISDSASDDDGANLTPYQGTGGCIVEGKRTVCQSGDLVEKPTFLGYQDFPTSGNEKITTSDDNQVVRISPETHGKLMTLEIEFTADDHQVIFAPGNYLISSLKIAGDGTIVFSAEQPTKLDLQQWNNQEALKFNHEGSPDNLQIWLHDFAAQMNISSPTQLNALIISEVTVSLSGGIMVNGAVTTKNLSISNSFIVGDSSECINPQYAISVTPSNDLALMCGTDVPTFEALTTKAELPESLQVTAAISPSDEAFDLTAVVGTVNDRRSFTSNEQGVLTLAVSALDPSTISLEQDYTLTLTLTLVKGIEPKPAQTVKFRLVPYLLEAYDPSSDTTVTRVKVIAEKPNDVPVRLLACQNGSQAVVAESYSGTPNIEHDVVQPQNGLRGTLAFAPSFRAGTSTSDTYPLQISESGHFTITMSDRFQCTGYDACPSDGNYLVNGSFDVYSRPWTLAICAVDTPLQTGTASSGARFVAASERFPLKLLPIVWQPGGDESADVDVTDLCSANITQNFFHADAPVATVGLGSALATPASGTSTVLLASDDGLTRESTNSTGTGAERHYLLSSLYWQDVGSLKVTSSAASDYFDMPINVGFRQLGRFYPKYFQVIATDWDHWGEPSRELPFTYMDQPFDGVRFDVKALSSRGENVANYSQFAPTLQAKFNLVEQSSYAARFLSPTFAAGTWSTTGGASVGIFSHSGRGDCGDSNTLCWRKGVGSDYPDGPFNRVGYSDVTLIGVQDNGSVDPIDYQFDEHKWLEQPDLRFGRAKLSTVGGTQGADLSVPLLIETWQSGRFRTSVEDSKTALDAQHFCYQVQWPDDDEISDAVLANATQVISGQSRDFVARQTGAEAIRESVRFWLTLSGARMTSRCAGTSNAQPWFQYDWDGNNSALSNDEEDPRTTVTFGIYRGNDRVIFKGEPEILGQ